MPLSFQLGHQGLRPHTHYKRLRSRALVTIGQKKCSAICPIQLMHPVATLGMCQQHRAESWCYSEAWMCATTDMKDCPTQCLHQSVELSMCKTRCPEAAYNGILLYMILTEL